MDKLKKVLNGKEEEEDQQGIVTQIYEGSTLSWSTRLKGFIICFVIGCLLSVLSTFALIFPTAANLKLFAILYTFGNITALGSFFLFFTFGTALSLFAVFYTLGSVCGLMSTMFLMGPVKQLKNMFKEKRIIATSLVILFLALTLCAALWAKKSVEVDRVLDMILATVFDLLWQQILLWKIAILAIIFCICQFLALIWYSLSYIPYARDAVTKCFQGCLIC